MISKGTFLISTKRPTGSSPAGNSSRATVWPSTATGAYRRRDDVLITDENGDSEISAADLALAVLDEIEHPTHRRRRFHVAH